MKTKTLTPPPHYRTLSHTTTFAPPHDDASTTAPAHASMSKPVGGLSDAEFMLNKYLSLRDAAAAATGLDPKFYDDCVNFYATKVEREKAVTL